MKESHECEVATHIGPESCGAAREVPEQHWATGGGGDGGKRVGQREPAPSKTRPGHRAGKTRPVRWSGYVKQQSRIGSCDSRRSCTTSTTWTRCVWPTSR